MHLYIFLAVEGGMSQQEQLEEVVGFFRDPKRDVRLRRDVLVPETDYFVIHQRIMQRHKCCLSASIALYALATC